MKGYALLNDSNLLPLNIGGIGVDLSATGGTSQFLKQNTLGGTPSMTQPATTDLSDNITWTDYSATSTIVGWSSFTTKALFYSVVGKNLFIHFFFQGTSNSTSISFTLPYTLTAACVNIVGSALRSGDNGGALVMTGMSYGTASSNSIGCYKDGNGGAWTASGVKTVIGSMMLPIQ